MLRILPFIYRSQAHQGLLGDTVFSVSDGLLWESPSSQDPQTL